MFDRRIPACDRVGTPPSATTVVFSRRGLFAKKDAYTEAITVRPSLLSIRENGGRRARVKSTADGVCALCKRSVRALLLLKGKIYIEVGNAASRERASTRLEERMNARNV